MDEDQKELLKVGAETAMKPFADLINRLFGGSVDQIGGMWEDGLRVRRTIRQLKLLMKLKNAIEDAGFDPNPIADKVWVPAVQAFLLEDDETMQDAWANMLANESDPRRLNPVQSTFPEILKRLTSREVRFLQTMFMAGPNSGGGFQGSIQAFHHQFKCSKLPPNTITHYQGPPQISKEELAEFGLAMDIITQLRLLKENIDSKDGPYSFTTLGRQFVWACQRPKKS